MCKNCTPRTDNLSLEIRISQNNVKFSSLSNAKCVSEENLWKITKHLTEGVMYSLFSFFKHIIVNKTKKYWYQEVSNTGNKTSVWFPTEPNLTLNPQIFHIRTEQYTSKWSLLHYLVTQYPNLWSYGTSQNHWSAAPDWDLHIFHVKQKRMVSLKCAGVLF